MAKRKPRTLTKAELRIMQVLWRLRHATVAEIASALPPPPLAYTTVLTMLRILEQKGIVAHEPDGRAHVYHPKIEEDEAASSAIGDLVRSFFADSKTALAVKLIAEERPSNDDLAQIKSLIARYEEEHR